MENTNIDNKIQELINDLKKDFHIPTYAYNYHEKFIPGVTPIYYSGPYFNDREIIVSIKSLLVGKWMSAGENVKEFEHAFSRKIKQSFSVMVNSGSSANLVMIAALKKYFNWTDSSEIIVSVVGFPTTVSVILQNQLVPVFIDIELDTLNFNLELIEKKITNKTKAIFVSPVLGNISNLDKIIEICNKYNLELILDNCDSLGSKWKDKYLTEYAICSSCSFYAAHAISTFEGGMISSNNRGLMSIVRSMVNWGRGCFVKETKIDTENGIKNIEDIVIGDKVFTHNGNYMEVEDSLVKNYSGELITIKCDKKEAITCTPNHKFLTIKMNDKLSAATRYVPMRKPIWVEASKLGNYDYLVEKVPLGNEEYQYITWNYDTDFGTKTESLLIDNDLMRLCGYWVAEGSLAKGDKGSNGKKDKNVKRKIVYYKYRVEFTYNISEEKTIKDTIVLMKKYFGMSCYKHIGKNTNGISLSFNSRKAYEFFNQFFNTMSYNKSLPNFFLTMNKEKLLGFLLGFWTGDGTSWNGRDNKFREKNRKSTFSFCTTSPKLFEQVRKILLRFEINPVIFIRTPEKHHGSIVNGKKIISKRNLYNLVLYGKNSKKINDLFGGDKTNFTTKNFTYFTKDNEYAIFRIDKIEKQNVENKIVYDLTVECDHSYHANGLAVHNCICSGVENLLPNGICNHRFDTWLGEDQGIIDHKYLFTNIGYNLKPLELCGAVGTVQIEKLDEICSKRNISKSNIHNLFKRYISGIEFPKQSEYADTVWFGTPIICKSKELKQKLVMYLEKNKIQTRNYFAGNLLLHPAFEKLDNYKNYPLANEVLDKVFFVGASPSYTEEIFNYFEEVLKGFKNE